MTDYDPQQDRAYKWEDSFTLWAGAHLSKREVAAIIRKASKKYNVPPPALHCYSKDRVGGKKKPSMYAPEAHKISLRPRHMNLAVTLHETAHAITDYILGELEPHGPEWLGIYMVLLEDFKVLPRTALHALADESKLRYRPRQFVAPEVIRKRYRRLTRRAKQERRA